MAGFKEYQMLFQLNASVGNNFQSTFSTGANSVSQLQDKINALNKTQGDIASYTKQQNAIDKTKSKIDLYQTQLQNLQNATANTSKEEAELANAIAAKEKQLTDATAKLDQQNAALSETGQALREAGVNTSDLAGESARLKTEAAEVAQAQKEEAEAAQEAGRSLKDAMEGARAALEAAGIYAGLKEIYGALMDCSSAAAQFETSMAGVKRTVGGSDSFISDLGETFKELSTQMPITTSELAGIATTAGQLGIAQDSVEGFTTVMAKLATTTDLTADTAATMLAQFSNITGVTDYDRLGSTVASLGDATATTASKVVEMSQGMAAAASVAGMSSTDILAISAAVGSLGIEAASGSTAMSTIISTLYKATETGEKLEEFASVAGMTADEFASAWGTDAVGALDAFIQGLNDTERNGRSAVVILDELGIKNVRQTKTILGLASAGSLLSNTVAQANAAWNQNTALTEKAGIMYNTTEAKMTMMQNAANNVKIAVGDALNPALSTSYDAASRLLEPVAEWIENNPALVQGATAFVGVLGLATAAVVAYTAATKLAAAASAIFSASIPGIGIILGVAAAVGLLTAGLSALGKANEETTVSFDELDEQFDNLTDQAQQQKEILDLVDGYKKLNTETENLQNLMAGNFTTEIYFTPKGPDDEGKLKPDDFINDTTVKLNPKTAEKLKGTDFLTDAKVSLTADAASYLAGKDFLTTTRVELDPHQHELLTSDSFLRDTKVKLTPEQKKLLNSEDFINGDRIIELTPEQATKLAAAGFMDDSVVYLTAEQANALLAADFLQDGSLIELTPEAAKKLKASEFMLDPTVEIKGAAGNTLSASDFGISDQTLTYLATMDKASYESVKSEAASLKSQIAEVDTQLNTANNTLNKSVEQAAILEEKIAGTKNYKTKNTLQTRLDEVNESIETQKATITELEEKHSELSSKYGIVGRAAEELEGKEATLLAIKEQLSGVTADLTTASGEQAAAYNEEADAAERAAKARQDQIREELYRNINKQSAAYADSLREEETAQKNLAETQKEMSSVSEELDNYAESTSGKLKQQYETTLAMYKEQKNNSEYTPELIENMATLKEMMHEVSGEWYELDGYLDTPTYTEMFSEWISDTSELSNEYLILKKNADEYGQTIENDDLIQQTFIDNLVNGLESGIVTEQQLRDLLLDSFKNEENAAAMVDAIMEEVTQQVESATEAAEEYAEASEEVTESTESATRSVDEIIDDLKTLQAAYKDAYESAYTSMSGQFDLFESAKKSINEMAKGASGGMSGMKKSLEEQATYITQYGNNYATASANMESAGVSQETANQILSNLSDGSVESAQYLQTLATASNEELTALAEAYEALQTSKETYAETVAEIQTDFSDTMTELQNELTETVANMEMSDEAAANAKATLDAYVNAADGYVALASLKYGAVAAAAVAALKKTFSGLFGGYAKGTKDAQRGMAWVGEDGPELMWFNGGETVMDHNSSVDYAKTHFNAQDAEPVAAESITNNGGGQYTVDYSPQYNFTGGMSSDDVKTVLEEHSSNMRSEIESILDEITEDQNRRKYA